jgi:broad specificity phosphatase PhoE
MIAVALYLLGFDLVYVRHAETEANATGHYSRTTIDGFSKVGLQEISALTKNLEVKPGFNRILVSPAPRTLRTIAPYLRATHRTATVWPLLYECCTGRRPARAHATSFGWGAKVRIPADLKGLFNLMPGEDRLPISSTYNAGLAQVAAALKEFQSDFATGRILLVGHSGMGGQFLHSREGRWIRIPNATPLEFKR